MGMVVRTNTMAMNANRQLGVNNSQVAKSLEKLSSGFRINRAADDASGLAISEKMKAQIKGLEQASANSQDGISLIQTAEGATTAVHDMLNRMVELATKSANGTIQNEVDREAIQREVDDLNSEITRISKSTNFNGINLLDGSLGGGGQSVKITGTSAGAGIVVTDTPATRGTFVGAGAMAGTGGALKSEIKYKDASGADKTVTLSYTSAGASAKQDADALVAAGNADADLNKLFTFSTDTNGILTITAKNAGLGQGSITSVGQGAAGTTAYTGTSTAGADRTYTSNLGAPQAGDEIEINGQKYTFKAAADGTDGKTYSSLATLAVATDKNGITLNTANANAVTATTKAGSGLRLQVGDTNDDFNHVSVSVDDLSAEGIGTAGLNVSDPTSAGNSIETIRAAINKVSTNRANLGSLQNRLEHTINNLDTTAENMTAANSRIRDTDMAKEMMNYTKQNILTQAAQAMLAQANQQPQAILQLLQ